MGTVAKFGGTSLADAERISQAAKIVQSNPEYSGVVVSAPGKRSPSDTKVTDLLKKLSFASADFSAALAAYRKVVFRFSEIIDQLNLSLSLTTEFKELSDHVFGNRVLTPGYIESRGEYCMARIFAEVLGWKFVDAKNFICVRSNGSYLSRGTQKKFDRLVDTTNIVVPGYYGALSNGKIQTFSRGGSDISGAILAAVSGACLYENWTDVPGVLSADPRIIINPKVIDVMTFSELFELTYMGATVLHYEAIYPVLKAGVPIRVRSTFEPDLPGTLVVPDDTKLERVPGELVGIAGRKGFVVITLKKARMNPQVGFLHKALGVLKRHNVSFEHSPGSIDSVSLVVHQESMRDQELIIAELQRELRPDSLTILPRIAMISIVGEPMSHEWGVAARIFAAIAKKRISLNLINQGSSEISIIIGVAEENYKEAIRAIYNVREPEP